jgi:NAD(P)-dependent dehydrogenase (short-subunit alcohol dehydrogenase family)/rhamnose utilization protein RhaD (predicted bifunctional aldolase and dehydrogenase)
VQEHLEAIAAASRRYGGDPQHTFGGGGNTSFKNDEFLFIKPSGVSLATLQPEELVKLDRPRVHAVFGETAPADPDERESWIKDYIAAAVCPDSSGRPSVETPVHEVMPGRFIVHTHSIIVNGMTCALDGEAVCKRLLPEAMWVEYVDPGYTLATVLHERLAAYEAQNGRPATVLILQSHGIFVAGDTIDEIDARFDHVLDTLRAAYADAGVAIALPEVDLDQAAAAASAPRLRTLLGKDARRAVVCTAPPFTPAPGPLTPDHIVYAKSYNYTGSPDAAALAAFETEHGYLPVVCHEPGKATYCVEHNLKSARLARDAAANAAQVLQLTSAFGGPRFLDDRERGFIENWEVEVYRKKLAMGGAAAPKRLEGKVALVTGAAQGFGKGIAEGLCANGATVIVADLNLAGAQAVAADLEATHGAGTALALPVDVGNEDSVAALAASAALEPGGIDLLVVNAGVLRAGSVKELSLADWQLVTNVNYTGYFLCVKHLAPVMARQWEDGRAGWSDIVQVNSKSGLVGSNKNAAYAGSKFGGIGLTQSFALELVADHIKVNSVCPGNYLDGPLWSDPERGLFVQYLQAGKVSGAETIDDVRHHYEKQVPIGRGCRPEDVLTSILYLVDQGYETGQALTITGGQIMR